MLSRLILKIAEKCVPEVKVEDIRADVERRHDEAGMPEVTVKEDLSRPLVRDGKQ